MIPCQKFSKGSYAYYSNLIQDIVLDSDEDCNLEELYDKLKVVMKNIYNTIYGD